MTTKHPQHDNLIIAANDKDALFECEESNWKNVTIKTVTAYPEYNWNHVKPYKYQHVKDAWEKDKSLVVQCSCRDSNYGWTTLNNPVIWNDDYEYRIKPKTITKRLYANSNGFVCFLYEPVGKYTIPINGTDTEVEVE